MKFLLIKDNVLPSVSLDMMFKVGSAMDPMDKEGLMSLLVEVIDKGTKNRSARQVVEDLETLGTSLSYDLKSDSVSFSVETLSWLGKDILEIFSDIIIQPVFLKEEFQRSKEKMMGWAERSAEDFSSYSSRVFNKYLYESHPYGFYQNGSLSSLKKIQLEDIKDFYEKYFYPEQAVLIISGQYPDNIIELLEKFFGNWKASFSKDKEGEKISVSPVPVVNQTALMVVNHEAAVQSEVRIGHISLNSSHPDHLALKLANVILGGSF